MSHPVYLSHDASGKVVGTAHDTIAQGYVITHPHDASKSASRLFEFDGEHVRLSSDRHFVLDVSGGSSKEGTRVCVFPEKKDGSHNQQFVRKGDGIFSKLGDGSLALGVNDKGEVIITHDASHRLHVREADSFGSKEGKKGWEKHEGELNVVDVGDSSNDVWGVNHLEHIYHWDGSKWHKIDGELTNISVGHDGTVWGVNKGHNIYRLNRSNNSWAQIPGELVQVSVGNADNVWGVNHLDHIYRWDNGNSKWIFVEGALTNVSVGHDGTVYGCNKAHEIYHWTGSGWQIVSGQLNQIRVASASNIVGVNHLGHVYRLHNGKDWEKLDGELSWVAVNRHGQLWGCNSGHNIYKAHL